MKLTSSLIMSFLVVANCSIVFSDELADLELRVRKAILSYEGCFEGHRYTVEREKDIQKIEFSGVKPLIVRSVIETSFAGSRRVRFGNYFSEPLLQYLNARQQIDPARPETDSTTFGVKFLREDSLMTSFDGLVPYFFFTPSKSLLEIYDESIRSVTQNGLGMRFEHSSGTVTLCEINSKDLITRITQQTGPSGILNDGSKAADGTNIERTLRLQWSDDARPAVIEILTELRVNNSVKGKGRVLVKDRAPLDSPLEPLISLDEFGLKNGDVVTCEELPGRFFQFMDGRVVAVADSQALSAARNSRWRNNFFGSAYFYGICTLLLLGLGGFIVWRRR